MKYGDKVKITSGFYEGQTGTAYAINDVHSIYEYIDGKKVPITLAYMIKLDADPTGIFSFNESDLEIIK